jgi:hypothetical protein
MSPTQDQFGYVNRAYGLSVRRGSRVEYTGDPRGPKQGSVTSGQGQYINIRFDGDANPTGPFHPTWELRYLDAAKPEART